MQDKLIDRATAGRTSGLLTSRAAGPAATRATRRSSRRPASLKLKHAKLAAFGATRRAGIKCEQDAQPAGSARAPRSPCLTIFGKTWRFQATEALRITPEENLELIEDSVRYLEAARAPRWSSTPSTSSTATRTTPSTRSPRCSARCAAAPTGSRCATPTAAACRTRSPPRSRASSPRACDCALGIHSHNDCELRRGQLAGRGRAPARAWCRARSTASASAAATPT